MRAAVLTGAAPPVPADTEPATALGMPLLEVRGGAPPVPAGTLCSRRLPCYGERSAILT